MWMSNFARIARPALQKSTSAVASHVLRALRRPGQAAGCLPSGLTSVQLRGQQSLVSASHPVSHQCVKHARALNKERMVEVEWEDGGRSLYPFTWLRDNCQCPLCTLHSAQARELLMCDLDIHTGVDTVEVTKDNKVSVVWPDQHTSVFDPEWLKKRCFSSAARQALREELFLNDYYYWDSNLSVPTGDFEQVLQDDSATLAWLLALRRFGIVCLKGAPAEEGQVTRLSERIGFLRLTFYGHTWHVQDKNMANNLAYTSKKLGVHTDYPALIHQPGVQFIHCIKPAVEGGESQLVDGFHIAEKLHREDPEAYQVLTSLRVNFCDTGRDYCDFKLNSKQHIIKVDCEGQVQMISCNNATRDSVLDLPVHQVQPFYRAFKTFTDLMDRPENVLTYRMESGDVMTFDNWRLLHGRNSYVANPDNGRHLEGTYLDWDVVMSRLRFLQNSVHKD